ncbi:hypothetical protein M5K25_005039 [Dendrobium thyrsiflorum]|uniref:Uncharacterized protein n=1 Tax=Dendrobium thyrsiflorum TaxID=117978 RepID=A0ABD0VGY9_DENTH
MRFHIPPHATFFSKLPAAYSPGFANFKAYLGLWIWLQNPIFLCRARDFGSESSNHLSFFRNFYSTIHMHHLFLLMFLIDAAYPK